MCGGSSGTAFHAAMTYIKKHNIGKGKRCVVILPDNIRNYMTKHLNNDWMYERGYMTEEECAKAAVSDLIPNTDWGQDQTVGSMNLHKAEFISFNTPVSKVLEKFQSQGYAQYPVKTEDGEVMGSITKSQLLEKLVKQRVQLSDPIGSIVLHYSIRHVSKSVTLNELGRILVRNKFVLVENEFMVTTTDLLTHKVQADPALSVVQPQNEKKEDSKVEDATDGEQQNTMLMRAGMVAAAGLMAGAAAVFMKKDK